MVAPISKICRFSTLLFRKDLISDSVVTNGISQFSMFVPTKATAKLDNGNTVHVQEIGIILCRFSNYTIIYPVGPVYYCSVHPSNTISSGDLKFYFVSQKVTSEPIEHCDYVDPQGRSWRSSY